MKRSLSLTREALGRLFFQRCFYLFVTLLVFIAIAPFIGPDQRGLTIRSVANTFVILSAVAAVGRSIVSFLVVLCLAIPALVFRWLSVETNSDAFIGLALNFDAATYVVTIALLLRYVFAREVMNSDRLWGAGATYILIGVLWSFLFAIVDRVETSSFALHGTAETLRLIDLIYFSFSALTTTGFGDVVPLGSFAKMAATLEGIIGQLFIAILIAKLVGVYPPSSQQFDALLGGADGTRQRAAPRTEDLA
jgi:hypothetical protein